MWRYGCPESPDWDSDVESWTDSEGTSSSELCAHSVQSTALHVIGQNWSGEKVSLFLEDWELAREAWSCHIALDKLCQEVHEGLAAGFAAVKEACCHSKGAGCGERKIKKQRACERQAEVSKEELRVSGRKASLLF